MKARDGRRKAGGLQLAGAAFLAMAGALANAAEAPKGDATRGKASYFKNLCHTCHGTAGQGGDRGSGGRIAPNPLPWEAFVHEVRHPRESMPRYSTQQASDQDVADMHAYLSSLKPGPKASEIPLLKE
jgi:mono/diheme cytochrome c family protein